MVDSCWRPTPPNGGSDELSTSYLTVYGNIASSDVARISEVPIHFFCLLDVIIFRVMSLVLSSCNRFLVLSSYSNTTNRNQSSLQFPLNIEPKPSNYIYNINIKISFWHIYLHFHNNLSTNALLFQNYNICIYIHHIY